jgi:hypothetical protein
MGNENETSSWIGPLTAFVNNCNFPWNYPHCMALAAQKTGVCIGESLGNEIVNLLHNTTVAVNTGMHCNFGLQPSATNACKALIALVRPGPPLSQMQRAFYCTSLVGNSASICYHSAAIWRQDISKTGYIVQIIAGAFYEGGVAAGNLAFVRPAPNSSIKIIEIVIIIIFFTLQACPKIKVSFKVKVVDFVRRVRCIRLCKMDGIIDGVLDGVIGTVMIESLII